MHYFQKKFMEIDYNMLIQNHVKKKSPYGVVVV